MSNSFYWIFSVGFLLWFLIMLSMLVIFSIMTVGFDRCFLIYCFSFCWNIDSFFLLLIVFWLIILMLVYWFFFFNCFLFVDFLYLNCFFLVMSALHIKINIYVIVSLPNMLLFHGFFLFGCYFLWWYVGLSIWLLFFFRLFFFILVWFNLVSSVYCFLFSYANSLVGLKVSTKFINIRSSIDIII